MEIFCKNLNPKSMIKDTCRTLNYNSKSLQAMSLYATKVIVMAKSKLKAPEMCYY